jgi:hypothetical protein
MGFIPIHLTLIIIRSAIYGPDVEGAGGSDLRPIDQPGDLSMVRLRGICILNHNNPSNLGKRDPVLLPSGQESHPRLGYLG